MHRVEQSDVIVVGAGPAGLAVARQLRHHHGIQPLVVDRASAPAISWRLSYDTFRLNTSAFLSHSPGQRISPTAGRWATKDDMIRYYDAYVQQQNISIKLCCDVEYIDRVEGGWRLNTSLGNMASRVVVLATGNYRTPTVPTWPGIATYGGALVHSGDSQMHRRTAARTSSLWEREIRLPTSPCNSPTAAQAGPGWRSARRHTSFGAPSDQFRATSSLN